ncbi:LPXTG cell wall anchor domain-containing protein [Streptomyces sp. NPDC058686]|uniref:LPXTG cell wall anchor domain-containing protein n=1 Tax=Streptomyces sp. NPDC058686 TaxID=3346599 RepID=UPI003654DEE2
MTKKTRIRVARIAAGAVIAAGASLTAAGAASALDLGVNLPGADVNVHAGGDGVAAGVSLGGDEDPTDPPTEVPTDPPTDPTDPPTEEPTDPPTSEPTDPTEEPTEPTEDPTAPTEDPTSPGDNGGGHNGGGNGNTDPDGGNNPVEQGQGKDGLQDTGSVPVAQPAQKGKGGELAETGAAETTFLLIGAATMIAGGIGFRLLPRLAGGGRTVA